MKIKVGKAYEGGSQFRLEDGDYEVQITDVESTKGRATITFSTANGVKMKKIFFLLEKDGKTVNDRGMAELADYITTAMQIEDMEVEVNAEDCKGYYLLVYVKNKDYISKEDGSTKKVYNVYSPRRCNGFTDGAAPMEEEPEVVGDEVDEPVAEIEGEPDDIFKKFGL